MAQTPGGTFRRTAGGRPTPGNGRWTRGPDPKTAKGKNPRSAVERQARPGRGSPPAALCIAAHRGGHRQGRPGDARGGRGRETSTRTSAKDRTGQHPLACATESHAKRACDKAHAGRRCKAEAGLPRGWPLGAAQRGQRTLKGNEPHERRPVGAAGDVARRTSRAADADRAGAVASPVGANAPRAVVEAQRQQPRISPSRNQISRLTGERP